MSIVTDDRTFEENVRIGSMWDVVFTTDGKWAFVVAVSIDMGGEVGVAFGICVRTGGIVWETASEGESAFVVAVG